MPSPNPVVRNAAFCLAHLPEWVRYGSKPRRELAFDPSTADRMTHALRSYSDAVAYPPNQVFIGNLEPRGLRNIPRPWFEAPLDGPSTGPFGEIVDTELFTAFLALADVLEPGLVVLTPEGQGRLAGRLSEHPLHAREVERLSDPVEEGFIETAMRDAQPYLPLWSGERLLGAVRRDSRSGGTEDEDLRADVLLENLCAKASGAHALQTLLAREAIEPEAIDYIISCGEEAVGDRYQRGGGGMAKAIGERCGCSRASGMDVKNFCAAPASALVTAAALVKAGLYGRVAVVAGGSLAKLGMKMVPALERGIPILEDCVASLAFLVTSDDGVSPRIRLEPGAVGLASIGASTSDEAVYRDLLLGPLETLGLSIGDIDRFAPELHNEEIMELSGSGDVAHKNYRTIAAMAVIEKQLERSEMNAFITRVGMPGFSPTQGHVPSGLSYLGHGLEFLQSGPRRRIMVLAKASLFLGRCTELYDGVSFVLEGRGWEE